MATKTFKIGLSNTDKQNMAQEVYERLLALTFPEYDTTESYEVGDFVVYNDQLYKCIGATTGAWDSSKWQLATLNDLLTDIESAVAFVNDKANVDGNYPTMTVGVADNLSPYDEESGIKQHAPFNFQASGTNNGGDATATVGSLAIMSEKRGNSVVVNQHVNKLYNHNTSSQIDNVVNEYSDNVLIDQVDNLNISVGHKALFIFTYYNSADFDGNARIYFYPIGSNEALSNDTTKKTYFKIGDVTNNNTVNFAVSNYVSGKVYYGELYAIDLTQWFNGDIPQDLLDNPDHFFRYYQGDLSFNEGTLVNANSRYLKAIGRNQCDEVFEGGYLSAGQEQGLGSSFRTKNFIKVIPGATYHLHNASDLGVQEWILCEYDKDQNFIKEYNKYSSDSNSQLSPNCCYVRFAFWKSGSGWDANVPSKETAQVVLSVYYEGESGYDQYYPYEELTNNDTGTEELGSIDNDLFDTKQPSDEINRKIIDIDLGSLNWVKGSSAFYVSGFASANGVKQPSSSEVLKILASVNVVPKSEASVSGNKSTYEIYISSSGALNYYAPYDTYADGDALKTALNGKHAHFELATPTTEQGTPYSENIAIDDFGTMDFSGTSGVPQGNNLFYPVDYKAYLDTLHNYTDGDADNLALKSDLSGLVAQVDVSNGINDVAGLTYEIKKAYKTGNVITLTIRAQNKTGSNISANNTLFTLPSGTYQSYPMFGNVTNPTTNAVLVIWSDGAVYINENLPDNGYLTFTISYAVA